jgi:hypothetical protein
MEYTTLTVETASAGQGLPPKLHRLWIEQQEILVENHSISEWLERMTQQGWNLIAASATPSLLGAHCNYKFQRPKTLLMEA